MAVFFPIPNNDWGLDSCCTHSLWFAIYSPEVDGVEYLVLHKSWRFEEHK